MPSDTLPIRRSLASRSYAQGVVIAGKYVLVRPLGEGGMGSVWVALNQDLDTHVALKLIRADLDAPDADERLLTEARAAARLGHRAIVRVFDFGRTEQGDPFIVMELLDGENLGDVLAARRRLDPVKACQILLPIADALATAHDRGIVHRDLKPENVFLAREVRRTQPKVVDFGIAKVQGAKSSRSITERGVVIGSPGYMSPEQARGLADVDHRSDVWALAVVLYECIAGRAAFEGDNYNSLLRAIIEQPVRLPPEIGDPALFAIIERALEKDPARRYSSMREFGAALARWLVQRGADKDVSGEPLANWLEPPDSERTDFLASSRTLPSGAAPALEPERSELASTWNDPRGTTSRSRRTLSSVSGAVLPSPRTRRRRGVSLALSTALIVAGSMVFIVRLAGQGGRRVTPVVSLPAADRARGAVAPHAPEDPAGAPPVAASAPVPVHETPEPSSLPVTVPRRAPDRATEPLRPPRSRRASPPPAPTTSPLKDPY
jgi:serine/threonine-protein kinase